MKDHKHSWIEKNNKLVCNCGKSKLKLVETDTPGIKKGIRDDGTKYLVRDSRDEIFFPQDWKAFYDELLESQKLTFYLLQNTGARIFEIKHLKPEHIDYKNQRLTLVKTKQRPDNSGNKKSKTRIMRINKRLSRWLKKEENLGHLKEDGSFRILTTSAANLAMKKAMKKAGIKKAHLLSIHNIRKTSENWSLGIGIDSMLLSKKFGHNMITAYMHYSISDAFTYKEKDEIREIFEDTYI